MKPPYRRRHRPALLVGVMLGCVVGGGIFAGLWANASPPETYTQTDGVIILLNSPCPTTRPTAEEMISHEWSESAPTRPPWSEDERHSAVWLANRARVFGGVELGCLVAAVALGLLDCRPGLAWAACLGLILTGALILAGEGQGAFLGPFIFPLLLFWPLIGLGRLVRIGLTCLRPKPRINTASPPDSPGTPSAP